jgi:hypothetical protein
MLTWKENILSYYQELKPPRALPNQVEWLYPHADPQVMQVLSIFCEQYYNDTNKRILLLGINPGRFGAGVTGVNFTAPKQLKEHCGIGHSFKAQSELSAEFIYEMITAYGGPKAFYSRFFIGSVCPLGFVQHGKNINYYDDKELKATVEPFIIKSIESLISFQTDTTTCLCIGGEKNYKYLSALNQKKGWFGRILTLPHPRFIMQYKRKQKEAYVELYLEKLREATGEIGL